MPAKKRNTRGPRLGKDGLTHSERIFANALLRGKSKREAFQIAYNKPSWAPESVTKEAYKVSNRPRVIRYIDEAIQRLNHTEMDSREQALRDLQEDIERARDAQNYSALATLSSLRLKTLQLLTDRVHLSRESQLDDDAVITALAAGNTELEQQLRTLLAGKDGFDA